MSACQEKYTYLYKHGFDIGDNASFDRLKAELNCTLPFSWHIQDVQLKRGPLTKP